MNLIIYYKLMKFILIDQWPSSFHYYQMFPHPHTIIIKCFPILIPKMFFTFSFPFHAHPQCYILIPLPHLSTSSLHHYSHSTSLLHIINESSLIPLPLLHSLIPRPPFSSPLFFPHHYTSSILLTLYHRLLLKVESSHSPHPAHISLIPPV